MQFVLYNYVVKITQQQPRRFTIYIWKVNYCTLDGNCQVIFDTNVLDSTQNDHKLNSMCNT